MVMLTIQSCHDNDCLIPLPDKTDFQTPLEIDSNICNVIASINSDKSALTRNSDYSFETELFNLYGLPIWTNPVVFTESDKIVYLIPIIDNNDDEEINAILYFVMDSQIGRASCRERVCQYVSRPVHLVSFKQNKYASSYDSLDKALHDI